MKKILVSMLLGLTAATSFASGVTVQGGTFDNVRRAAIGYEADPLYSNGAFSISPVYELAQVRYQGDTLVQVSAVPMLRYTFSSGFYVEGGIGASFFNHTVIGDKTISTSFQFSDNLGVGYRLTSHVAIAYRLSHYSNLDLKQPNPGINMQQVVLTVGF